VDIQIKYVGRNSMGVILSAKKVGQLIDGSAHHPALTYDDIKKICEEAVQNNFILVSASSSRIRLVKKLLMGSSIKTGVCVGFPFGCNSTESKISETLQAIKDGATEIDMVAQISALKSKDYDFYKRDIKEIVDVAKGKAIVKVIIETCYLSQEEKIKACELIIEAGADFIKTSTGYGPAGATLEDVSLFSRIANGRIQIKAAGGIRTLKQVEAFLEAGATRIGTSSGAAIVQEAKSVKEK